ncbi:MAG: hypothetical protein WKF94_17675 [Solirubrobacteraceae bacterium]
MLGSLLGQEALYLLILTTVGIGPASLLVKTDRPGVPLALAPAFGMALCVGVLETVNFVVPLRHGLWFAVLPMAVASIALAVRRVRCARSALRPTGGHLLGLAAVAVVALGVLNYPLVRAGAPGPVAYGIFDATVYVSNIDAAKRYTNDEPFVASRLEDSMTTRRDDEAYGEIWDLSARSAWGSKWQHQASMTVPAVVSGASGMRGWTLLTPFMVVCLLTAAFGAYSLTVSVARAGPGAATMAGALVPGSALLQIFLDGSVGQMASTALLPLGLATSVLLVSRPTTTNAVLAGIAFGGIQAVYPELLAISVVALGGSMALAGLGSWRRRGFGRPALRDELRGRGGVLVLAAGVAVVVGLRSTPWTLLYPKIANLGDFVENLVDYNVSPRYLPGWLLQTREFYSFAFSSPAGLTQTLLGAVLPLLLGVLLLACLRYRRAWLVVVAIVVAVVQAVATNARLDCSYCVQRSLLSISTMLPVLLACGLSALLAARRPRVRECGVALAALAVGAAVLTTTQVLERAARGLQATAPGLEALADRVAELPGATIALEGFQSRPFAAWLELPTTYIALREATDKRLSIVPTYVEWGGLNYFGTRSEEHPAYDPRYGWVVSRLGGIEHGRREVFRNGPVSVQQRSRPFDVLVAAGVATDDEEIDSGGTAWVQAPGNQLGLPQKPLTFWIAAESPAPAYLRLRLVGPPGMRLAGLPQIEQRQAKDGTLSACVRAPGRGARRIAELSVTPTPPGLGPPPDKFDNALVPARTVRLAAVRADLNDCERL